MRLMATRSCSLWLSDSSIVQVTVTTSTEVFWLQALGPTSVNGSLWSPVRHS